MAGTRTQTQVQWSAADFLVVSSATEVVSDEFTIDDTTVAMSIQLSADNAGTPASGDTAVFRVRWSNGDILGDTGNDYDTAEHSQYLYTLDTYATNTPGEDPAVRTIPLEPIGKYCKITCTCANAGARNITIRALISEQRWA